MKNLFLYTIIFMLVFAATTFAQDKSGIEGNWKGTLDAGGAKLTFVLKITKDTDDYAAKLDIIEQNAGDLPIDSITLEDGNVKFSIAKFGFGYEGKLNEAGDEINGTFKQGAANLPLNFKRATAETELKRPQTPKKPYPYNEEEVSYKNEKDNIKLVGTLTFPKGEGKFPAVVLITGSGSQDRNSTILGHQLFLVLADHLTRKGIAVLRVDDRGVGGSDLGLLSATMENYVGDVLAGIDYLRTRAEIDQKQIGLIGHSEGGTVAPLTATHSKDVAFIVMLAGTAQMGDEIILSQVDGGLKANGATTEEADELLDLQKNIFKIIKSEPDNKLAKQKINEMMEKRKTAMNEKEKKEFAIIEKSLAEQLPALLSAWYRFMLSYNPRPTLEKVKIPVLALNGENDTQVLAKENLEIISAALKKAKNKDLTVKSFRKLNHLFQTSETGLVGEYGEIEETIAPQVLETISDWILKRTILKK